MEQIIFNILIFIIGTLFGSFSTLAVYRIPLHQDITHKRSYCPNCNHKLGFLDMIPILSYIFLGGKCRYCKQKIRTRYLLLEAFTGIVFLLYAMSLNINFYNLELNKLVCLVIGMLYIAGLIITAGIDKEKISISRELMVYEIVILSIYMIYLYIVQGVNIYRYVIYLLVLMILFSIDVKKYKKQNKDNYTIGIVILSIVQFIFVGGYGFAITVALTFIALAIYCIINKIVHKGQKCYECIPIGYYMCILNIITIIVANMVTCGWLNGIF